ncbi:MAG TPA: oxygen-independent coproporphyrinogen III oxidase [Chitinophagales bacterium]|nr:oxygen-independent coproporphyrinogen III oxidase [Chitinophagales bacterium]HQW77841.1 oxygen-independent coproporphyrinogen III oxidase [Chitinophagales bacterium]HRB18830.1 oxygen-independent coproporphyrinogen III oxidase [Chitinophagales bacterium]HRB69631.1 oxygen-independent coproporphyrinogen III oxidase [Chitinophagales bacterium]HRB92376.1 oxygen-independent coproporphyrinogen III oxidase [Chitinophagales bacterium]
MISYDLIDKYNVPIPRYTSYPTVPFWKDNMTEINDWTSLIHKSISTHKTKEGISIYIHLPFCEQLCTYCGCNKRITKNHSVEEKYIDALLKEWEIYKRIFNQPIVIRELHLGGGTPTFFSPENLTYFLTSLFKEVDIHPKHEFSFEGHPNNTTQKHLQALYDLGFRRVSFGVQDMDIKVQIAINRIQPFEKTKQVTQWAREIGYESINFDLIYGLPFQTITSIQKTIEDVITLMPDRIAFYSYAHVPWTKKSQRAYDENDLPKGKEKYLLYEMGKNLFLQNGYADIGMDHFALKNDALLIAKKNETLHRNFMGYTTTNTEVLIGLGVSAISDVFYGFRQNVKTVEEYYEAIANQVLPIYKGIDVSEEDIIYRKHILNIACKGKTNWQQEFVLTDEMKNKLSSLQNDGIILWMNNQLEVTNLGWSFLRNICAVFDKKMNDAEKPQDGDLPKFSQAI